MAANIIFHHYIVHVMNRISFTIKIYLHFGLISLEHKLCVCRWTRLPMSSLYGISYHKKIFSFPIFFMYCTWHVKYNWKFYDMNDKKKNIFFYLTDENLATKKKCFEPMLNWGLSKLLDQHNWVFLLFLYIWVSLADKSITRLSDIFFINKFIGLHPTQKPDGNFIICTQKFSVRYLYYLTM